MPLFLNQPPLEFALAVFFIFFLEAAQFYQRRTRNWLPRPGGCAGVLLCLDLGVVFFW